MARHCETEAGQALALATEPSFDKSEVQRLNQLLAETYDLAGHGLPSLSGISDVSNPVKLCAKEGVARGEELYKVGTSVSVMQAASAAIIKPGAPSMLVELAKRLPDLPKVHQEIQRCLDGGGDVLDAASTELALARHKKSRTSQKIVQTIQSYVSGRTRELLSDPVYTTRQGRYVIPLKAENRGKIRGIVHDTSGSGQTIYVEPEDVVQLGNQLREAEAHERAEVEKVLRRLSALVGNHAEAILDGLEASAQLDLVFAKTRYGHTGCVATLLDHPAISVQDAKHPLLDPSIVVPLSLSLGGGTDCLLITGPNTGGKTVAIKVIGLSVAMSQSGMMVPAAEAKIGVFSQIWADIGDEQSVQQSLSTFSGHIKNVSAALRGCRKGALVLLDEVGAGTDPAEGAALAQAVLSEFQAKGALTMASTHYGELKVFAANTPGFMNASMEFDVKSLRPTYKLLVGTPGSSHALRIAERYGVPKSVIELASQGLTVGEHDIAKMIERLEVAQRQATKAQSEADRLSAKLRQVEQEASQKLKEAEQAKQKVRLRAAEELEEVLRLIRLEAADVFHSVKKDPRQANQDKARTRLKDIQTTGLEFVRDMRPSAPVRPETASSRQKLEKGMVVSISGFDQKGTILDQANNKTVLVQIGALKMHIPVARLTPAEPVKLAPQRSTASRQILEKNISMKSEITLRELRAEIAKDTLEQYLDDAILAGLQEIRIVHGKGEGILRKLTQEVLKSNSQVKAFREGLPDEGGYGVTIATLR